MWEFQLKNKKGETFWDLFFSGTSQDVLMEQDVGWTTCAGYDPCEQFRKYPGRSVTLHAKENGMGKNVTKFDAILGQPGQPGAKGVDWDNLAPVADADGVKWWVVECERHFDGLMPVTESFKFLKSKGRC
jgi:sugar phosphate isomerase/epimerase